MALEHSSTGTSIIDVLDRVLDKGIVVDAWVRVSLVGIDLVTVEARVVVASIETYLKNVVMLAELASAAPHRIPIRDAMNDSDSELKGRQKRNGRGVQHERRRPPDGTS
jgi:hypothetical protein